MYSFDDDDADTLPGTTTLGESELLEAVEWLKNQGYISGEQRPFASLLKDAE